MIAGAAPLNHGVFELAGKPEFMYVQYMPVKMPDGWFSLPENLTPFWSLFGPLLDVAPDFYVYLTAKHLFHEAGTVCNRPGWHCDGFGSDDVNYIWADSVPTEFCVQPFDLPSDHAASMKEMERQADARNIVTFPDKTLLCMDQTVVHRPSVAQKSGFRIFAKISVSRHKYDLEGNAKNPLLNYDWHMRPRKQERNDPVQIGGQA